MPDGLRLSGIFRGNGRPSCVFQAGHPMQESGTRPGLNLQQDFFFFLSLSHRHQPPREITGPKNPQLREKFWRYRPGIPPGKSTVCCDLDPAADCTHGETGCSSQQQSVAPGIVLCREMFQPLNLPPSSVGRASNPARSSPDNVNDRRAAVIDLQAEKAAWPAAPCASYCYHALFALPHLTHCI